MCAALALQEGNNPTLGDPNAGLERMFIEEYLRDKGASLHAICKLPQALARRLMTEACTYASNRLAEVEMRAQLVRELHGQI